MKRRDPTAYELEWVTAVYDEIAAPETRPSEVLILVAEVVIYLDRGYRGIFSVSEQITKRLDTFTAWERTNLLLRLADLARVQLVAAAKEHEAEARRLDRERGDGR
jgi:hypothetical protein